MHAEVRNNLNNCLINNDEDYSKCETEINQVKQIGNEELQENIFFDYHNTVKVQNSINQCKDNFAKAKELLCDAFPERNECVQIKEKTFACISKVACSELHKLSSECFNENERMENDSLWKYIFKGQDVQTKQSFEKHCTNIQSDLIRCFDKYYLLGQVIKQHPEQGQSIDEGNFNFYGPITPDQLRRRQKALEKKIQQEKEQERRYREQQ
ncbi:predicted protein [Naegleria gruberi]|uniref:Predicted protein n=1 Tax=Naegleria gruberi TaxID=5762 RepID=D2VG76_NAEGR|nr:uncharacterized protein NAEGRDRAFT_49278 [Naegleria gruberi]EFC44301.1 predicted protein [Naegleria gruberi]|eukprot:XP_002677045.1 predicted protein [Naegleria gruberi strain NEG-M]